MTIGQLSFYDQVKLTLLGSGYFTDNMTTHFLSSLTAVSKEQLIDNCEFIYSITIWTTGKSKYDLRYTRVIQKIRVILF